jgi:hypothetical protein
VTKDLRLQLTFHDPDAHLEELKLTWHCLDWPYVLMWLRTLIYALKNNHAPFSRFSGFTHRKSYDQLATLLNEAIELINHEGLYKIEERAGEEFDQEFANRIHHHFEILSGDMKNPSDLYQRASPSAREAIGRLNYCIHDMEAIQRATREPLSNRYLAFELWQPRQFWLQKEELRDFTMDLNFGDLCLHYGLIGKSWFEVFLDHDDEIFADGIRPLDVLGPEFDIHFLPQKHNPSIIKKFHSWLRQQGQDPDDPKLALGFLPLARLQEDRWKPLELIEELGKRQLKAIRIWQSEGQQETDWLSKELSDLPTLEQGFWKLHPLRELGDEEELHLENFPVQTFRVRVASQGASLVNNPWRGQAPRYPHTVGLFVAKDGGALVVPLAEGSQQKVEISPGQSCHFLGDGNGLYKLLKS